ncbi:DUF6624 domain-containing protein [Dyadobacter endophyticus]|nr:DUF6624 domain-containing protein [Dyadobacter endophyticus]
MKLISCLFCVGLMFVAVDAFAQSGAGSNDKQYLVGWFVSNEETKADIDTSIRVREHSVAQIRDLLSKMEMVDQLYRDSLMSVPGTDKRYLGYVSKLIVNDKANQAILTKIIAHMGWPKLSVVGKEGVNAAWMIVWHANRPYQDQYFPLIKKAYHSGEIPDDHFRTLEKELSKAP